MHQEDQNPILQMLSSNKIENGPMMSEAGADELPPYDSSKHRMTMKGEKGEKGDRGPPGNFSAKSQKILSRNSRPTRRTCTLPTTTAAAVCDQSDGSSARRRRTGVLDVCGALRYWQIPEDRHHGFRIVNTATIHQSRQRMEGDHGRV